MSDDLHLDEIAAKLCRALDRDRGEAIVASLASAAEERSIGTWPQRHAQAMAAIRSADPEAIARAIVVLTGASRSFAERRLRSELEMLLFAALATALNTTIDDVRARANLVPPP